MAALLGIVGAWARIGETPEQCAARYGNSLGVLETTGASIFSRAGVRIIVHFHEGIADYLVFVKEKPAGAAGSASFTDNEIQLLLAANGGPRTWGERNVLGLDKEWETGDLELFASKSFSDGYLVIMTAGALHRAAEKTAAAEQKKLEGF